MRLTAFLQGMCVGAVMAVVVHLWVCHRPVVKVVGGLWV
jgi:hypothetical protein